MQENHKAQHKILPSGDTSLLEKLKLQCCARYKTLTGFLLLLSAIINVPFFMLPACVQTPVTDLGYNS